jgi:hypothetical protein
MKPNNSAKNISGNSENFIIELRHLLRVPHQKNETGRGAWRNPATVNLPRPSPHCQ